MQLQMDLKSLGYSVAGPAPSVERAFKILDREPVKAALLDVHLGNENSIPIANKLADLDIPFLFITGFERVEVDSEQFDNHILLRKPINSEQLDTAMHQLLAGTGEHFTSRRPLCIGQSTARASRLDGIRFGPSRIQGLDLFLCTGQRLIHLGRLEMIADHLWVRGLPLELLHERFRLEDGILHRLIYSRRSL